MVPSYEYSFQELIKCIESIFIRVYHITFGFWYDIIIILELSLFVSNSTFHFKRFDESGPITLPCGTSI